MKRLALTIPLLLLASVAWATDISVPAGSDLNLILKTAMAGNTYILDDGNYAGGIWVSERSGTPPQPATATTPAMPANPITLKALNRGKAHIVGSSSTRTSGFNLYKSSWWVIDGIVVENASYAGFWLGSASNFNTIRNCVSQHHGVFGLLSGTSDYLTIEDSQFCFIDGPLGQHSIYASQTPKGWKITRCQMYKANRAGLQLASQGVVGTVSGFVVDSCKFWQCGLQDAAAAVNCLGASGCVFSNCTITDCVAGGFVFSPSGMAGGDSVANLVTNCVVTFSPGTGRTAVQQTGGNCSVVGCRIWCGKPIVVVQPITVLSGGIVTQSDNLILAPMPTTIPVVGGGTGGINN